ncbi:hypothetical protein BSKO_06711 [Bryopsis sp. KO-2023]|nr:hypothetical protein BSKO_06711 [Bryopsis sp. KO-2023]
MGFNSMVTAKHGAVGGRCIRLAARNTLAAARISRRPGILEPVVTATVPSAQLAVAVIYGMIISTVFGPLCCGGCKEDKNRSQSPQENDSRENENGENSRKRDRTRPQRVRLAGSDSVVTSEYTEWCDVSTDEDCESLCEYAVCEPPPPRQSYSSDTSRDYVNPMFFEGCEGCFDPHYSSDEDCGNSDNELEDYDDEEYFETHPSLSLLGRYSLRRSLDQG